MSSTSFAPRASAVALLLTLSAAPAFAAINNWTNDASGLWRVGPGNWSADEAPSSSLLNDPTQITNAGTKTVTIDAATAATNLSLRGLILSAPAGATNTLALDNVAAGSLNTTKPLLVGNRAVLLVNNSAVSASDSFDINGGWLTLQSGSLSCALNCDLQSGSFVMNAGTVNIAVSSTGLRAGRFAGATASILLNGGTVITPRITLGSVSGAQASLNIAGGTLICSDSFSAAQQPSTLGNVMLSSGNLVVTNGVTKIADRAAATFTQIGGNASFAQMSIGDLGVGVYEFSSGAFNMFPRTANDLCIIGNLENGDFNQNGGVAIVRGEIHVADAEGISGTVRITGGQFVATNALVAIGRQGMGSLVVSNALVVLTNTSVGRHVGSSGSVTVQAGGELRCIADLSIGRLTGAAGVVSVEDGQLSVTNDDIWVGRGGDGTLITSAGVTRARRLHIANSDDGTNAPTGSFTMAGGVVLVSSELSIGTTLLSTGTVAVMAGTLAVTNSSQSAVLDVQAGAFTMLGGELETDLLRLTNSAGTMACNHGILRVGGTTVANGQSFVVGDGVNPATLILKGGIHSYANGLVISPNATATGCGTIIGNIVNNGTLSLTNCNPPNLRITAITKSGNNANVTFPSFIGLNHTLEFKTALTNLGWTPVPPGITGDGSALTLTDSTATNASRFYRVHAQ